MNKKTTEKTNKTNRYQLIKKFWLIANEIGKDFAYDVVESLYHQRSISTLTLTELDRVIRELQEKSGYQFKAKAQPRTRGFFVLPRGFFANLGLTADISTPLKKKIQVMTKEAGISTGTLANLVKKMAAPSGYFGINQAQKVIEALKNMKTTGWKETGNPQRTPQTKKSSTPAPTPAAKSQAKTKVKSFMEVPEKVVYNEEDNTYYGLIGHWWSNQDGHA